MKVSFRVFSAILLFFVSLTFLPACNLASKGSSALISVEEIYYFDEWGAQPKEATEAYRKAVSDLQALRYSEALEGFDLHLKREPVSPWTQAALLNSGRALEGLQRWSEAESRYRSVIRNSDNSSRLQALALYRMSFVHEALDRNHETVAVLQDLSKRANQLPEEIAEAELPARLAAGYARVGNFKQAIELYDQAENGIMRLRKNSKGRVPNWLPSTLYFMGTMANQPVTWENFESALRPLPRAQLYLLKAAELGVLPWSNYAVADLTRAYNNLFLVVEKLPGASGDDPVVDLRALQKTQTHYASLLLETLYSLRARFMNAEQPLSLQAQQISEYTDELDKRIQALLMQRPPGDGVTAEVLARREEARGRVLAPDTTLEMQFIKSASQAEAKLKVKEEPTPAPSAVTPVARPTATPVATPTATPPPPVVAAPVLAPASTPTPKQTLNPAPSDAPSGLATPAPVQVLPPAVESEDPNL